MVLAEEFANFCELNTEKPLPAHDLHKVYCSHFSTKQSILQRQVDAEVISSKRN